MTRGSVRSPAAEDEELGGQFVPLFYGWQDNPFNSRPFVTDQARDRFERSIGQDDDEEILLREQFGVTLEQLWWRRTSSTRRRSTGNVEKFHQEHPATPEQAFIGSGQPVFSGILVARAIKAAEASPAPVEGVLRGDEWVEKSTRRGTIQIPQKALWVPSSEAGDDPGFGRSRLLVWEHPVNAGTEAGKPRMSGCRTAST
jgi:hypothetical protein